MKPTFFRLAAVAIVLVTAVLGPALAEPVKIGDLEIDSAWTRATPPKAGAGGGFMTISNRGSAADRLINVATPLAKKSEIHKMELVDGVMKMSPLADGLELPAGQTVELKPGGLHLMLMGLTTSFVEGKPVPVTLTFERAGTVDVLLVVGPIGAKSMPHGKHTH